MQGYVIGHPDAGGSGIWTLKLLAQKHLAVDVLKVALRKNGVLWAEFPLREVDGGLGEQGKREPSR